MRAIESVSTWVGSQGEILTGTVQSAARIGEEEEAPGGGRSRLAVKHYNPVKRWWERAQ